MPPSLLWVCFLLSLLPLDNLGNVHQSVMHEVQVRATMGEGGLGLILAEEREGSRWVVKGFRPMPGGKPNPDQVYILLCFSFVLLRLFIRRYGNRVSCMMV